LKIWGGATWDNPNTTEGQRAGVPSTELESCGFRVGVMWDKNLGWSHVGQLLIPRTGNGKGIPLLHRPPALVRRHRPRAAPPLPWQAHAHASAQAHTSTLRPPTLNRRNGPERTCRFPKGPRNVCLRTYNWPDTRPSGVPAGTLDVSGQIHLRASHDGANNPEHTRRAEAQHF
jgi:hypothetical protein